LCFPSPTRFVEPRKIRNPKVIGTRIIPLSLSHATIDNQETIELKSK
jgi:hypothetical protein